MEFYVEKLSNGNLKITTHDDFIEEIQEAMENKTDLDILCEGMEHYSCNGSYTPFGAADANPFVGITDAPCIAEVMNVDDNGDHEIEGDFWYYGNYMVENFIQVILDIGYVIFRKA